MNARLVILGTFLLTTSAATAQIQPMIAGAGATYNSPVGSLHGRFKSAVGGMIFAGVQTSPRWTWVGKFEYFELSTLNTDQLFKTVNLQEGGGSQTYRVPLSKLTMNLKAAGFTAEAALSLLKWNSLEASTHVGFGFYTWDNYRGAYYDSLLVQSSVTGKTITIAHLAVPDNRQTDWSGSINAGIDGGLKITEQVWFTAGVDYRLIVGELWQALDLDLESVSGMQTIAIRAGIKVEF